VSPVRAPVRAAVAVGAGVLLLLVTLPNLGPVVRAGRAEGTRGTFTAEELRCVEHPGHEQCSWHGRFRAPGRAAEPGTYLYGAGRGDLRRGESVTAIDVGRPGQVYPPTGSREWMVTAAVVAIGAVLVVVGARALHPFRRPKDGSTAPSERRNEVVDA
jgi:hypothetical protein